MPNHCNSETFELLNNELYLTLSFEYYSLKFLDMILQEGPQDSLSGTVPPLHLPDVTHVTLSPRPPPFSILQVIKRLEVGMAWERG